jgi:hypothetical protein
LCKERSAVRAVALSYWCSDNALSHTALLFRQEAQAAHLDLGILTVTSRGTALGLEILLNNGSWVMAEQHMGDDDLLIFGGQQLSRLSQGHFWPLPHRVRQTLSWCEPGLSSDGLGSDAIDADDGDGGTSDDAAGQRYGTRFSELLFLRAAGSAVLDPLASRGGNMLPGLLRADAPLGSTAAEFEEFIRQNKVIVG